jgi:hypothetical protein
MLANDTDLAEDYLGRFEAEEAMTFEPSARRLMLRYALRVLAEVAREDARRERGEYPGPNQDPVLAMPLHDGHRRAGLREAPDLNRSGVEDSETGSGQKHARHLPLRGLAKLFGAKASSAA